MPFCEDFALAAAPARDGGDGDGDGGDGGDGDGGGDGACAVAWVRPGGAADALGLRPGARLRGVALPVCSAAAGDAAAWVAARWHRHLRPLR